MSDLDNPNLPIIGESKEAKALRELDARIDRFPLERRKNIGLAIEAINQVLDTIPPEDRTFAILYHSRALAMRLREAQQEAANEPTKH
jgi:hypothetical protein